MKRKQHMDVTLYVCYVLGMELFGKERDFSGIKYLSKLNLRQISQVFPCMGKVTQKKSSSMGAFSE
jgi:hypothetical protein